MYVNVTESERDERERENKKGDGENVKHVTKPNRTN